MMSVGSQHLDIFPRMSNRMDSEESDYVLYPESQQHNLFSADLFSMNTVPWNAVQDRAIHNAPLHPENTSAHFLNKMQPNSPSLYPISSPELRAPSSYSTASGPSAASSTMGSPYSSTINAPEWAPSLGLGLQPNIVAFDTGYAQDYGFGAAADMSTMESELSGANEFAGPKPTSFVDPSLIHPSYAPRAVSIGPVQGSEPPYNQWMYPAPNSPTPSHQSSHSSRPVRQDSRSPYISSYQPNSSYPYPPVDRQPSVLSAASPEGSFISSPDPSQPAQKGRCTYPDCGKIFKDLKAHQLTHQASRPEKCPIATCDYHIKGFARKYDKNRHTLTHYKGTMVCGFCPGSGSAAEKSFNRADVFKRHLTSVHAVEQTPPNSRKKTSGSAGAKRGLAGYAPDATGKCSTCSQTFTNAQDFYEHLDDCVLRIVQQEEPSEAINAARLQEVENDASVHETLRNNNLPIATSNNFGGTSEEDYDDDDDADEDFSIRSNRSASKPGKSGALGKTSRSGVQKSRGLAHSKGGVTIHNIGGRKKRKDYPSSWGCATSQMKMKKRVMCVFDGPRRLWKDDMMLDTDYEVRMKLAQNANTGIGGQERYITDLDVHSLRRTEAIHGASEGEKGPWISDDLSSVSLENLETLMGVKMEE